MRILRYLTKLREKAAQCTNYLCIRPQIMLCAAFTF